MTANECNLSLLTAPAVRKILAILAAEGPLNVKAIAAASGLNQPIVSHYLSLLRLTEMVDSERTGRSIRYSLTAYGVSVALALATLLGVMARRGEPAPKVRAKAAS